MLIYFQNQDSEEAEGVMLLEDIVVSKIDKLPDYNIKNGIKIRFSNPKIKPIYCCAKD